MNLPKWLRLGVSSTLFRSKAEKQKDITDLIMNSRKVMFNGAVLEQYLCRNCGNYSNDINKCTECEAEL